MSEKLRVAVDMSKCQTYGLCVAIHPGIFDIPEGNGRVVVSREIVDSDDRASIEEAMWACPAQAITLQPVVDE
ncbi:ferredoxin [Mycobacterium deserti]|uniref:Ferredoxin n=1 Tax=Mycobacterium deserti TaxID=2978347 RepID=A0ABT2M6V2_9MYCO|nr:ferredoxin [Mycobacterium deserti]MCT7657993.1 ferredoxin [Mycobacterium deserti]